MKVQSINNTAFGAKNTFLNKSKIAQKEAKNLLKSSVTPLRKANATTLFLKSAYNKSLHYEAKARLKDMQYNKLENSLEDIESLNKTNGGISFDDFSKIVSTAVRMVFTKNSAINNHAKAFETFPERFYFVDNQQARHWRHYTLNYIDVEDVTKFSKYSK